MSPRNTTSLEDEIYAAIRQTVERDLFDDFVEDHVDLWNRLLADERASRSDASVMVSEAEREDLYRHILAALPDDASRTRLKEYAKAISNESDVRESAAFRLGVAAGRVLTGGAR